MQPKIVEILPIAGQPSCSFAFCSLPMDRLSASAAARGMAARRTTVKPGMA